ncbi:uncharacterized protein [Littorina saxatilis]|uniref:uncharacterized protein n=1 Tax=Littorina saxatilis TaxID=31220 RepID=UPI0038B47FE0
MVVGKKDMFSKWITKASTFRASSAKCLAVMLVLCLWHEVKESQCMSVSTLHQKNKTFDASEQESHDVNISSQDDEIGRIKNLMNSGFDEDSITIANELLLVTVLKESRREPGQSAVFWVDHALVYVTVTVESTERGNCVLVDQYGNKPQEIISSWSTRRWTIHRPTIGEWRVVQRGEGGFNVTVQGASGLDLEVSLYHTDINTGVAQLVHDTPTAGHNIRTIIDIIGADVMHILYNVTLVTSDGREVASDWLRPEGDPDNPQYETTFTWPSESVYIRVYGEETNGNLFERQTPFIISPIPIDLQLMGGASAATISPKNSLDVRYRLTNHGPSDTFVLTAALDRDVFSAVISPARIRLGHMGSFVGSVMVSVAPYTPATTGLLTISAWTFDKPTFVQSTTLFLTSQSDNSDEDPPFCNSISVTGNCTEDDVTSSTCNTRYWVVHASVDDAASGLRDVTFADVAEREHYSISPFTKGQANEPIVVVYVASCCSPEVLLDTSDVAGNEHRCEFSQSQIQRSPVSPKSSPHKAITTPRALSSHPGRVSKHTTTYAVPHFLWRTITSSRQNGGGVKTTTRRSVVTVRQKSSTPNMLGDSFAAVNTVTNPGGGKKPKSKVKEDYSTLKMASIALGSVGGIAGVVIATICVILYYRHRRLQRQRQDSDNSGHSNASESNNDWQQRTAPDLLRGRSSRREPFNTHL